MAKFETKTVLMLTYHGHDIEILCELEKYPDGGYFWKFPKSYALNPMLDVGDTLEVKEIEVEVE